MSVVGLLFYKTDKDERETLLLADIEQLSNNPNQDTDAISYHLKNCIIDEIDGIDTNEIEYYSKINAGKLLVLLNIKKGLSLTEVTSRKQIVFAVEDCLKHYVLPEVPVVGTKQIYIGVKDKFSFVLIKTPDNEDMDGTFANNKLLFPFYGDNKPVEEWEEHLKTDLFVAMVLMHFAGCSIHKFIGNKYWKPTIFFHSMYVDKSSTDTEFPTWPKQIRIC